MKKLIVLAFVFAFASPAAAYAASFVVTPASGSYHAGDLVTLALSVDPEGGAAYASVLDARFSPETFTFVSFTPASGVLPLTEPGYDLVNETTGALTKTVGYPGGARSVAPFGTLVLRASASGTGTLTVNDASQILDGANADQQAGTRVFSFTITPAPSGSSEATPRVSETLSAAPAAVHTASTSASAAAAPSVQNSFASSMAAVVEAAAAHKLVSGLGLFLLGMLAGAVLFARRKSEAAPQEKA